METVAILKDEYDRLHDEVRREDRKVLVEAIKIMVKEG